MSYNTIDLNDDIIEAAIKLVEQNKEGDDAFISGSFMLAVANSTDNYRLEKVIERIAKERFASDIENGEVKVDRNEGRTSVGWEDYANQLCAAVVPSTYASRPRWFA